MKFKWFKEDITYRHIVEITSDDCRSFLIIDFNPVIYVSKKGIFINLIDINCMKDIAIPGFEFTIVLPLIKIFFRRNSPESDAVYEKLYQTANVVDECANSSKEE